MPGNPGTWLQVWSLVTCAASLTASLIDAALLQRRRGYFTGGFLSTDYVRHPADALAFLFGSLLSDAALVGVAAAVVLWVSSRLGIGRRVAIAAALLGALVPLLVANVIEYQLMTYLGDTFDLALMLDLTGNSPAEILAVSSAHLWRLAFLVGGGLAAMVVLLWVSSRASSTPLRPDSWRRTLTWPALVLLVGLVSTTVLRSSSDVLDNGLRRKPSGRLLGLVVARLSDVDRDGYGLLGRPPDPAPFDSRIYPYALDLPGNGIDEDGVGGDLPAGTAPYAEPLATPTAPWTSKPDLVLVVLESVRADAVGATVDGKPVTPVLDALAAGGVSSQLAFSHNGYTAQSRHHLFSGGLWKTRGASTLIDDFKAQGYETAYFSAQDESFGGPELQVGFNRADVAYDARADRDQRYSSFTTAGSLAVPYDVLNERIQEFLASRTGDRPLFLYVNYHDAHFPYHHRFIQPILGTAVLPQGEIAPGRAAELRAMYLNTVANVDRAIGEVLDDVRHSLGREPAVIVLADHGESLFDEGFLGHGYALNDVQTRIPLIVANLPMVIDEPFGQADLRGAIHEALGTTQQQARAPVLMLDAAKGVFHYLGTIDRPAQIAWRRSNGQTIYDFRSGLVQVAGTNWRRPEDLAPAESAAFLQLVQAWERMRLARRTPSARGGPN